MAFTRGKVRYSSSYDVWSWDNGGKITVFGLWLRPSLYQFLEMNICFVGLARKLVFGSLNLSLSHLAHPYQTDARVLKGRDTAFSLCCTWIYEHALAICNTTYP